MGEKSADSEREGIPEPREGLWYGDIQSVDYRTGEVWARHRHSLNLKPDRLVRWDREQLPVGTEDLAKVGKQYWWDEDAALTREELIIDDDVLGFFPVIPFTEEDIAEARAKAHEAWAIIDGQD